MKMLKATKSTTTTNVDKNKHINVKPVIKNKIQSKSNQKIELHRSLEAFSDCV
jgi:hypothetical protein